MKLVYTGKSKIKHSYTLDEQAKYHCRVYRLATLEYLVCCYCNGQRLLIYDYKSLSQEVACQMSDDIIENMV